MAIRKFNAGDKVEVIRTVGASYSSVGKQGIIVSIKEDDFIAPIKIYFGDNVIDYAHEFDLKHIDAYSTPDKKIESEKLVVADLFAIYKDEKNKDKIFKDDVCRMYKFDTIANRIEVDGGDISDRMWTNDMYDRKITEYNVKIMTKQEIEKELGYEIVIREDD